MRSYIWSIKYRSYVVPPTGDRAPKRHLESWGTYLPGQDALPTCDGSPTSDKPVVPSGARRSQAGQALPTPPGEVHADQEEPWRRFLQELSGSRDEEYAQS